MVALTAVMGEDFVRYYEENSESYSPVPGPPDQPFTVRVRYSETRYALGITTRRRQAECVVLRVEFDNGKHLFKTVPIPDGRKERAITVEVTSAPATRAAEEAHAD